MTRSMRWCCLLLVVPLVLTLAESTQPAQTKRKFKTVTRTFSDTGAITINFANPASPYPAMLQVGGFKKGKVKDVNLSLHDFSHDHPDSVDMLLVAANGSRTLVMSDVGGSADVSGLTLTLDDEAVASLPDSGPLSEGTFQPTNIGAGDLFQSPAPAPGPRVGLSLLDGGKPNGEWQLFIVDGQGMGSGSIDGGWSLEITAKVKKHKKKRRHP